MNVPIYCHKIMVSILTKVFTNTMDGFHGNILLLAFHHSLWTELDYVDFTNVK